MIHKYTICAITINSSEERNLFEKEVKKNPKKFNPIVELTDFGEDDWFEKSCISGIRCDQLIVSGHFGGTFFGSSGKSLSMDQLESKGCSKSCEGILSNPYEVFLFGCNTLSTKEKDGRTPQQYLEVLLNDGISRREAELVVESRYGSVGDDHKSKMQRAFKGNMKNLYGFDSIGPSGKNVEGFLKKYFSNSPLLTRLDKLQARRAMNQVAEINTKLAQALKTTSFAQCNAGGDVRSDKERIICTLRNESKSVDQRLGIIIEALSHENYLTFVPSINAFLKEHPASKMTDVQMNTINEIKQNQVIRNQIKNLIESTQSLTLLAEWISFAKNFSFIDVKYEERILTEALKKLFAKEVALEQKDVICSLPFELRESIKIKGQDLKEKILTTNTIAALGCLRPQDLGIHLRLLEALQNGNYDVRNESARAFEKINPQDPKIQQKILETLHDEKVPYLRFTIINIFGEIMPKASEVQLKLIEVLKDEDYGNKIAIVEVMDKIKPQDLEVQLKLAEALKDKDRAIRYGVAKIFVELKPIDPKILKKIRELNPELWEELH